MRQEGRVISDNDLAADLRRARHGDLCAAARVYDQTCAQAWLLATCLVGDTAEAHDVMIQAYRGVLHDKTEPTPSLSPRAWVLSRVHIRAHAAIAARSQEPGRPDRGLTAPPAAILAAIRVKCAHLLTRDGGPPDQNRRR